MKKKELLIGIRSDDFFFILAQCVVVILGRLLLFQMCLAERANATIARYQSHVCVLFRRKENEVFFILPQEWIWDRRQCIPPEQ
jgi:hypothetical protein